MINVIINSKDKIIKEYNFIIFFILFKLCHKIYIRYNDNTILFISESIVKITIVIFMIILHFSINVNDGKIDFNSLFLNLFIPFSGVFIVAIYDLFLIVFNFKNRSCDLYTDIINITKSFLYIISFIASVITLLLLNSNYSHDTSKQSSLAVIFIYFLFKNIYIILIQKVLTNHKIYLDGFKKYNLPKLNKKY
ncbi:hypothetical protein K4T64_07730 [Staphylococcus epidermidis]|nr:hypothetical protein [Staphylococcus epidermidis]MCG2005865.1 hypothetical protein [Staphylococcus epidermidis]MCG2044281.1 hypothetical protein [Staphylococcus epidermidis]MCG2134346.1 hypothetical protein [Staphylococcus epidermidis]